MIRAFRQKHPHIRFHFTQNYSHSQLKQLLAGELDLCLLAAIDTEPPVCWKELWRDELFIMVPPIDHPLAHRKSIKMKELEHESFVLMKKGYALRRSADRLLNAAGIKPKISYEGDEVSTIAGFVGAGLGVSLLPDDEDLNPKKSLKSMLRIWYVNELSAWPGSKIVIYRHLHVSLNNLSLIFMTINRKSE